MAYNIYFDPEIGEIGSLWATFERVKAFMTSLVQILVSGSREDLQPTTAGPNCLASRRSAYC